VYINFALEMRMLKSPLNLFSYLAMFLYSFLKKLLQITYATLQESFALTSKCEKKLQGHRAPIAFWSFHFVKSHLILNQAYYFFFKTSLTFSTISFGVNPYIANSSSGLPDLPNLSIIPTLFIRTG